MLTLAECVNKSLCVCVCVGTSEEFDKETGQVLSGLDKLPLDLKEYVKEDNQQFERELEEWDAMQARKAQQEKLAMAAAASAAAAAAAAAASPRPMISEASPAENTGQSSPPPLHKKNTRVASESGVQDRKVIFISSWRC